MELYSDLVVFAIVRPRCWLVGDDIFITKRDADFSGYVRQFVGIINGESPAPSGVGYLAQQPRPLLLLYCAWELVIKADGKYLHVSLLHNVFDFSFGVAAVVVAAVGDDE